MKYTKLMVLTTFITLLSACDSWTDVEVYEPTNLTDANRTETYYANLRAYKQRTHTITYAKWQGWTGVGDTLNGQMRGLPDSLDVVGLTADFQAPTAEMKSDMEFVRKLKGTKVIVAISIMNIGDGFKTENFNQQDMSIQQYADKLIKLVLLNDYDGLDIELLPESGKRGSIAGDRNNTHELLDALSRSIGPRSGNEKLLFFSGDPTAISAEEIYWFNHVIAYAFGSKSDADLDNIVKQWNKQFIASFSFTELTSRLIVMEDFLSHKDGGVLYKDRFNNGMLSLEGMARWIPLHHGKRVTKGGVGIYRMDNEYTIEGQTSTYPATHKVIQILNPSIK